MDPASASIKMEILRFVVFLISTVAVYSQDPGWIEKPINTFVNEGGNTTLKCRISNRGSRQLSWNKQNGGLLFVDGQKWTTNERYSILPHPEGYDLRITNSQREEDGEYSCSLQLSELQESVRVTVVVIPGQPSIQPPGPLAEGETLSLTCSSIGGNPPPSVIWKKNDVTVSEGIVTSPPGDTFGVTSSVLTTVVSRLDHRSNFTCSVENDANIGSPRRVSAIIAVQYSPVISFGPYNPLTVIEEERTTLTCVIDANPLATDVRWIKDGTVIGTGVEYMFPSIQKANSGIFSCQAGNSIGTKRENVTLHVQYAPKVALRMSNSVIGSRSLTINEGQRINLTCVVDANPKISGDIEWTYNYGPVISYGPSYIIESVSRMNAGNYSCRARNTLTPSGRPSLQQTGSTTLEILVQYSPGAAEVSGPDFGLKGQSSTLVCKINDPGLPTASLQWTKFGSNEVIREGSTLTFDPVSLYDNDDYICTPRNEVGDGAPDTYRLIVNEIPEFVPTEFPATKTVQIHQRGLVLTCKARGRPEPRITWYKDNNALTELDGFYKIETTTRPVDTHSWNVTSTLYWKGPSRTPELDSLRIADAGTYSCRASSEISQDVLSQEMRLNIQYPPVINISMDKVAIDINQTAILNCQAHSVPPSNFTWYRGSQVLTPGGRMSIMEAMVPSAFPYRTTLSIQDVVMSDLASYRCEAINAIGQNSFSIQLVVRTIPDPPSNLNALARTWESVELQWQAAFDGGYSQHFIVAFESSHHSRNRVRVTPPHATIFNVTGLYPDTNYTFRIFGENELGGGDYSKSVTMTTSAFSIDPPLDVLYHKSDRTLTFKSPSSNYCGRVENFDGRQWRLYEQCANSSGSKIKVAEQVHVKEIRVALCLQRRQDICSEAVVAEAVSGGNEDLPPYTIIIVAVVCGTIVLALLIVLIVLCCRRQKYKQKETDSNHIEQNAANREKSKKGIDNPVLGGGDTDDPIRSPVFSTNSSSVANNSYGYGDRRSPPNGHVNNGYPVNGGPQWNKRNGEDPPSYDSVDKGGLRIHDGPDYIPMKSKSQPDHHLHPGMNNSSGDSGVSTPDPAKPKKVIYEVVV